MINSGGNHFEYFVNRKKIEKEKEQEKLRIKKQQYCLTDLFIGTGLLKALRGLSLLELVKQLQWDIQLY